MMKANFPNSIQEILMASSEASATRLKTKLLKEKKIRKIAPKIYTTNMDDSPEDIIRRNLFYILGQLFPHAVISFRTAYELKPTVDGQVFITYEYTKNVQLPGVLVHVMEGPAGTDDDMPFIENLYISSQWRRALENLQKSRARGHLPKCLPQEQIEEVLERILQTNGEEALNQFRDKAREVSKQLRMPDEFKKLDSIIGALLSTHASDILRSKSALARSIGVPYDQARIGLFQALFEQLHQNEFANMEEPNASTAAFRNFAFFESYFSNYIEGTEFELEEAKQIIDTGLAIENRGDESHDVLGTFQIVASRMEMQRTPSTAEELIQILKDRHRIMMSARKSKNPGMFKMNNNRAGDTHFVDFSLVNGTLRKGFEYYQALEHPFAKALFMLFMVSEVHPFVDGNGRISRIMMNAELVHANQSKIIIPTVFRDDYLGAIRKLSRKGDPSTFVHAMQRVRDFSFHITGSDFDATRQFLTTSNAFKDEAGEVLRW